MDCPEFRRHHLAYVDDTLPGDVLVAAERHRAECASCAAHDTLVRRSLLLARNLPTIEPSADFTARLNARLREEMAAGRPGVDPQETRRDAPRFDWQEWQDQWGGAAGWGRQAAAAAVLFAAVSAGYTIRGGRDAGVSNGPAAAVTPAPASATPNAAGLDTATFGAATQGSTTLGSTTLGVTTVAREVAAAPAAHPTRVPRRPAMVARGPAAHDADTLSEPAYIPLPAGVLEAGALLGPASAGVPVWPAALLAGEAPTQLRSVVPGAPAVRLVGLTH